MRVQGERLHNDPVALLAILSNYRLLSDCLGGLRFGQRVSGPCKGKEQRYTDPRNQESNNTYSDR